jgi:GNAT superfamily N-acetyltransferase
MGDTREQKIRAVETAMVESAWRSPRSQVIRRDGWAQIFTPDSREIWLNEVSLSALDDAGADAAIAATVASYRDRGASFRWVLGPSAAPADLGRRLEARGGRLAYEMAGMLADPAALSVAVPADVRVEAANAANIDHYMEAVVHGWGESRAKIPEIKANMLRSLQDEAGKVFYYLARVDGEPAGTAILSMTSQGGYLKGGSVDPRFRGRGVYRALLETRLKWLRQRASPRVMVCAVTDTSAPICAKLGFESVCRLRTYEFNAP